MLDFICHKKGSRYFVVVGFLRFSACDPLQLYLFLVKHRVTCAGGWGPAAPSSGEGQTFYKPPLTDRGVEILKIRGGL